MYIVEEDESIEAYGSEKATERNSESEKNKDDSDLEPKLSLMKCQDESQDDNESRGFSGLFPTASSGKDSCLALIPNPYPLILIP
jgi:hypothetical protein